MSHPYKQAPARAFWSRSVSEGFDTSALVQSDGPLVRVGEKVVSAGSCFASNLVPYLESAGLTYLRTVPSIPALSDLPPEAFGYEKFSAPYGNIYTVTQLLQLLRRSLGTFKPSEDRWLTHQGIIDPFRPGIRYRALSTTEFDLLMAQYLGWVRRAFAEADVFIFTLGLTETWRSRADNAVFPSCPGTVAGQFDSAKHEFKNFSVAEIQDDMDVFLGELQAINPKVRVILTVSPVPLVATASGEHVLSASTYSKSVLRVVAGDSARKHEFVRYFPSYEIVTGPQAPHAYFQPDRRNVSPEGVKAVMDAFLSLCERGEVVPKLATAPPASAILSKQLTDAECEEAMADR